MADHMTAEQVRAELVALNDFLGVVSGYAKIDDERVRLARGKLTALAARLSGMAADSWQPIETAPKLGRILGHWKGYKRPCVMWWNFKDNAWESWTDRNETPSHWMPLPAAPERPNA